MKNKKAKILIVDDSPTLLDLISEIVLFEGYEIDTAENGSKALEMIKDREYDLFLLDVMMPGLDGFSLCKKIKALEDVNEVPVIFLTARMDEDSINKGFEVGAVDYVMKPFKTTELLSRIKTHINLRQASVELEMELERRKIAEREIEERESMLTQVFNISSEGVRLIDVDCNILMVNRMYASFNDITIAEANAMKCYDLLSSEFCNSQECPLRTIQKTESEINHNIRVVKNNEQKEYLFRAVPFYSNTGQLIGILESFRDITHIRKTESSLVNSERKYKQLVENAQEGMVTITKNNDISFANNRMAEMLSYNATELQKKKLNSIIHSSNFDEVKKKKYF